MSFVYVGVDIYVISYEVANMFNVNCLDVGDVGVAALYSQDDNIDNDISNCLHLG